MIALRLRFGTEAVQASQLPETLFIERCVRLLKPGSGRCAIVLPDAILGSPRLDYVREWMLRKTRILASIDLHPDTFQPHVRVADGVARFTMAEYFATAEAARAVVDPFVWNWEFDACLRYEPGRFELEYDLADILDRRPTPGVHEVAARPIRAHFSTSTPRVTLSPGAYPSPPSDIDSSDADVQSLLERYKR